VVDRKTNGGVMQSELRLQQECYFWFHNNYPSLRDLFFKIKNEGHNRIIGAIDKATGLVSGVADMYFIVRNLDQFKQIINETTHTHNYKRS
jgi:hypothetical protein